MRTAGFAFVVRQGGELLSYEEIARVVRAAAGLGVRRVRLTGGEPLVRSGLPELVAAIARTPGIEEVSLTTNGLLLARHAEALARAGLRRVNVRMGHGPAVHYRLPGARVTVGFIAPVSRHFCRRCNRLRLTADGKLRPCLLSETGIDLRAALRAGATMDELQALVRRAVAAKPAGHRLHGTPLRSVPDYEHTSTRRWEPCARSGRVFTWRPATGE